MQKLKLSFGRVENIIVDRKNAGYKKILFSHQRYRGYLFFSVKDRNLFHPVDTISNIFTCGPATSENITDGVHKMK